MPATAPAAPPVLTDEAIFAAVQRTLDAVFGDDGEWTVARRSPEQDDMIFHEVLVHSLATSVTASVAAARNSLDSDEGAPSAQRSAGGPLGLWRAPRPEAPTVDAELVEAERLEDEPAALSWEPAPITRWADLKRPVTGPIAIVDAIDRDKAA